MTDQENYRGFVHLSRAWYGYQINLGSARYVDEVMLGFYGPDSAEGEIAMRWYELNHTLSPRLEVFNDSWRAMMQMPDLLALLSDVDGVDFGPDEFCRKLVEMGFRDETPVDDDKRADIEQKIQALIEQERAKA